MSEGKQPTEKIFCNTCKTVTNHCLRDRYATPRIEPWDEDDPVDPVRHAHRYSLWSCAGCGEATIEKQCASEDIEEEWAEAISEYWPKRVSVHPKFFRGLNNELSTLYKEVITCFNEGCLLLCTIGLRALIEGVCNEKGLEDEKLVAKIAGLTKLLPSPSKIEALQSLRVFGNDAAHRLEALTEDKARIAIEVMEHLLSHFYDVDDKASQLKNRRRVTLDSVTSGPVQ